MSVRSLLAIVSFFLLYSAYVLLVVDTIDSLFLVTDKSEVASSENNNKKSDKTDCVISFCFVSFDVLVACWVLTTEIICIHGEQFCRILLHL